MAASSVFSMHALSGGVPPEVSQPFEWTHLLPKKTFHLWFLYYLMMIVAFMYLVARGMQYVPRLGRNLTIGLNQLLVRPFAKVSAVTLVIFLTLLSLGQPWVYPSMDWIPSHETFVFFLVFYAMGWGLFSSKEYLYTSKTYDWAFALTGFIICVTSYTMLEPGDVPVPVSMFLNAFSSCLSIFGRGLHYLEHNSNQKKKRTDTC